MPYIEDTKKLPNRGNLPIPKIRFKHDFHKLPRNPNGKMASLLYAHVVNIEDQPYSLLDYDTIYFDKNAEEQHYELAKRGEYIFLLFECEGAIFTTFRSYSKEKWELYSEREGCDFQIEIIGD